MTAPRRARSAWLLVGSTPLWSAKVHKAGHAEGLLGGESLGVGLEVAPQMRPADLASFGGQVRVGPPAIRGDDRCRAGQQLAGVVFVAVGADAQHGVAVGERAPQRAAL